MPSFSSASASANSNVSISTNSLNSIRSRNSPQTRKLTPPRASKKTYTARRRIQTQSKAWKKSKHPRKKACRII